MDAQNIQLRKATAQDQAIVVDLDRRLDPVEHEEQNRAKKLMQAIGEETCFVIAAEGQIVGFVLFDYRFFDRGWIELMVVDEMHRGKGIGPRVLELLSELCGSDKLFTSTNRSNLPMQRALIKAGFTFAGELNGLDEGDPEWFYYKKT